MTGMDAATNYREERRRDKLAAAQAARDDEAAKAQVRIAETQASARIQREKQQARRAERRAARKQTAARRAELAVWLAAHMLGLLFVPVIVVPGVLAWT